MWKKYWSKRTPGTSRPTPMPVCGVHGCENKSAFYCTTCKTPICGDHQLREKGECAACRPSAFVDDELGNDPCPFCGEDDDNCNCQDAIFGDKE